jgi:uncharacterized repeat protein (TIGR03843 family)
VHSSNDVPPGLSTLLDGELELLGRLRSSNAAFLAQIGDLPVIYKPIAGERPLWDFPDGRLAHREVASYLLSEMLGWDVVPETWLRDGPHGPGMVQRWCEADEDDVAVTVVASGPVPEGWHRVFEGYDAEDRPVMLVHEDSAALRRMAVFDVIVNNADRKGGHVLPMPDGRRYGIDHGLTFHCEPKLRTVLWGWAGERLTAEEVAAVESLRDHLYLTGADALAGYLCERDVDALVDRCELLIETRTMPRPWGDGWRAIPWPPF